MAELGGPEAWGRVDETHSVFVRDGKEERQVGQFPDGTADEALAYFVRKYHDLAGQVSLLELRFVRGTAGVEASSAVSHLKQLLERPSAVGDLDALRQRVNVLEEKCAVLREENRAAREAAKTQAVEAREQLVLEAEKLAAQNLDEVQWKKLTAQFEELFAQWQALQKSGPHLPKAQADELWKRFRKARQKVDTARRQHFSQVDSNNKAVRARKEALIAAAEALAPRGAEGVRAYRDLLEQWKKAGHASRKVDDQLWAKFKAAGDVLYAAKQEQDSQHDLEFGKNLELKLALLDEGNEILSESDHAVARDALLRLQKRYDAIGKVPRGQVREVEARMRKIESHVRSLADAHWQATNPETIARAEGMRGQLQSALAKLEAQLDAAKSSGDTTRIGSIEAEIDAKREWLQALGD